MSTGGGRLGICTNPRSLAGSLVSSMTMSIVVGDHTNLNCEPSYLAGFPLGSCTRERHISFFKGCVCASNFSLCGGMYSASTNCAKDWDLLWINLEKKLALVGRVPHDCRSPPGDCFFASVGHALYKNSDNHFEVCTAGVTHLINNPSLYFQKYCAHVMG